jgi:FKBP-type peptidyl-prolyl cis-trans isomerase (trigger factor)
MRRFAKFDEVCAHLASKLGHGGLATLSAELRAQISEEAEDLTDNWSELELSDDPKELDKFDVPAHGLQTLLAEHHELGERIMDIQDTAIQRELGDEEEGDAD